MNIERLSILEGALLNRLFPKDVVFNMNYGCREFIAGDLETRNGKAWDTHWETPMCANGSVVESDWCGTAACIAGLTVMLFEPDSNIKEMPLLAAQRILELDDEQAEGLFTPMTICNWETITPEVAADVVNSLRKTGETYWGI